MRRWKSLSVFAVILCFLCAVYAPAFAAETDYTYTIRFFSGQQGSIGGQEVQVFENLHYGDRVTFRRSAVSLSDASKYYVVGIRESGKDNNTADAAAIPSFQVTGDQDYVVAYGILGSGVAYTIHYEDEYGNELAPTETYYGNVGDRPVVAFLYIDGYQPQAYNMTKTLSENAAENVFTFVYTPIGEGVAPPQDEDNAPGNPANPAPGNNPADGGAAPADGGAGAAGDAGAAGAPGAAGAGGAGGAAAPGGGAADITEGDVPLGNGPQEMEDLDADQTPTGNLDLGSVVENGAVLFKNLPVIARFGLGLIAILLAGGGVCLVYKKRKQHE